MNGRGSDPAQGEISEYLVVLGWTRILVFLKIARPPVALKTLYKYANK